MLEDETSNKCELEVVREAIRASDCDGMGARDGGTRGSGDCVTSNGSGWAEVGVLFGR